MSYIRQSFKGAKKSRISNNSKSRRFFIGFKKGMQNFGYNLTAIINTILLSIVYLIGVGFTSIFAKLFRKHFIETKTSSKRETYWSNINLKKKPIENYYQQF